MHLHAAPIEWFLIVFAAVGVAINIALLRAAIIVQNRLREDSTATHPERIISSANVRQESIRLGKQMLIFCTGCAAVFLPPPPPDIYQVPQTLISQMALLGVSMMMTIASFIERTAQRQVAETTIRIRFRRATDLPPV